MSMPQSSVARTTSIEWTEATWNPVTGCDRVSPGCDHCYAMTLAKRLKSMGSPKYQVDGDPRTSGPGFGVAVHEDVLDLPMRWRKPRRVFVNSMSDLFHEGVPDEFIVSVFARMWWSPQHTFQVLTKRHGRLRSLMPKVEEALRQIEHDLTLVDAPTPLEWPLRNVWLGVSVENQQWADVRIPHLLRTPAAVRWLSCEPLLGALNLQRYLNGIIYPSTAGYGVGGQMMTAGPGLDWVVVGGESGPDARPMDVKWPQSIRDQCQMAGVPFFFKQWGGRTPKQGGRELDGRLWDEYPTA